MKIRATILICALLAGVLGSMPALAKEKEDPAKAKAKFPYRSLPVDVACLSGMHPTQGPDGPAFPCLYDSPQEAEIKTTKSQAVAEKKPVAQAVR